MGADANTRRIHPDNREELLMTTCEIPFKLPSLNDYTRTCRANRYAGAVMKKNIEASLFPYLYKLPQFTKPIEIEFHWIEDTKRRDYDNIAFAKKFILDALVKFGKLKDDNRRYVCAFSDKFSYGETSKIILTIKERNEEQ